MSAIKLRTVSPLPIYCKQKTFVRDKIGLLQISSAIRPAHSSSAISAHFRIDPFFEHDRGLEACTWFHYWSNWLTG